jgi:hypothetical protein
MASESSSAAWVTKPMFPFQTARASALAESD